MKTISLDGARCLEFSPQPADGTVRSLPLPDNLATESVEAVVPGNCELDLMRTGLMPPRVVSGCVVKGHGVASGRAGDARFPGGTVAMQAPFFKALGLDLSPFHPGTMNVDCTPWRYAPGPDALLFERIKWHPDMPAETFSFSRIRLVHRGINYPALVYWPHPETKAEHFQPGCVAEVIAPKIEGLAYGDAVAIESDPRQVAWQWSR